MRTNVYKYIGVGLLSLAIVLLVIIFTNWIVKSEASNNEPDIVEEIDEATADASQDNSTRLPSEAAYMQILHEMTHQKVEADQKWGYTPNTPEQIDEMLKILDEADYKNEKFYRDALTAWKNGDFSNAVEVHNTIWRWQGGTVGKAKRLLTPEEEQKYIESRR